MYVSSVNLFILIIPNSAQEDCKIKDYNNEQLKDVSLVSNNVPAGVYNDHSVVLLSSPQRKIGGRRENN